MVGMVSGAFLVRMADGLLMAAAVPAVADMYAHPCLEKQEEHYPDECQQLLSPPEPSKGLDSNGMFTFCRLLHEH